MTAPASDMKCDLHCHSHYSDGKHAPEFLLQRAHENAITHLAITDHDYLGEKPAELQHYPNIILIHGVEISCAWQNREIHVVGLCPHNRDPALNRLLATQREQRRLRMADMDRQLVALGKRGLWEYLEALPCAAYTRSHAADFLVREGLCKSRQKAFKTHLGKKGRIYAEPNWCALEEAVRTLRDAGGITVLAHPGRYDLSWRKLEILVADFISAGGECLEVSYGNIQPDTRQKLTRLAVDRQLYCSAGSDFHDALATWTDLGKFPALDSEAKKNAIWLHPGWHSLVS